MNLLYKDVINYISTFLSIRDLSRFIQVNKRIYTCVNTRDLDKCIEIRFSYNTEKDILDSCLSVESIRNCLSDRVVTFIGIHVLKSLTNTTTILSALTRTARNQERNMFEAMHNPPYELCRRAIEYNSSVIKYIPEEYKTREICKSSIDSYPVAYAYIPDKFKKEYYFAYEAMKGGVSISYVPMLEFEYWQRYELCRTYICGKKGCYSKLSNAKVIIQHFNPEERHKLYTIAIHKNYNDIRYVPFDELTYEMCKKAVQSNHMAINHVPALYRTSELNALAAYARGSSYAKGVERLINSVIRKDTSTNFS